MFQNKQNTRLLSNKLFAGVKDSSVININPKEILEIKEGDIIFQSGDPSEYVYLIIDGEVKQKISGIFSSPVVVKKLPGEFFGEKELIEKSGRTSSAVANTDCTIYRISKEELTSLTAKNKIIQRNLFGTGEHDEQSYPEEFDSEAKEITAVKLPEENEISELNDSPGKYENTGLDSPPPIHEEQVLNEFTEPAGSSTEFNKEDIPRDVFNLESPSAYDESGQLEDNEEYLKWDFSSGEVTEPELPELENHEIKNLDEPDLIISEDTSPSEEFDPFSVFPEEERAAIPEAENIPEPQKFRIEESYEEVPPLKILEEEIPEEPAPEEDNSNINETAEIKTEPVKNKEKEFGGLSEEKLLLIIEASRKVNSNLRIDDALVSIVEAAKELTNADRGTLYIVDKERNELWSKIISGSGVKEIRLSIGEGLAGASAKNNEIINLEDVHSDSRFNATYDRASGYKTKNNLCFPISNKEGTVIAVIQLLNSAKGRFDKIDEECLSAVSVNIALALENAELVEKLVQADRLTSLGKMANFLIQDIKKPVLSIKHYAEHIKKKEISNDIRQVLNLLIDQASVINDLIQSTLGFSQGKTILRTQVYPVTEVMSEILAQLAEYVEGRNVKLFKKFETDALVNVDKREFYQSCFQIVKNACDAMPEGGNVYITTKSVDNQVTIEIKDNGLGIPDSIKDRIFEPFMSQGKKNGNGLGLSIAEKIVSDHGGKITFESELGEGTSFFIHLPLVS